MTRALSHCSGTTITGTAPNVDRVTAHQISPASQQEQRDQRVRESSTPPQCWKLCYVASAGFFYKTYIAKVEILMRACRIIFLTKFNVHLHFLAVEVL
jgi:hypothetical protein